MATLGTNVETSVKGNMLTIKVDLSERHGPSASGKTIKIASTGGNKVVPDHDGDDVFVGLNIYEYAEKR